MADKLDCSSDQVPSISASAAEDHAHAGDVLYAQGRFQEALAHFLAAVRRQPEAAEHHYRAGLALWGLAQHDAAKRAFEEAILLKPNDAHAHGELGRVLLAMGQPQRAEKHARRAVNLAPEDRELSVALASVLEADGQIDAAWAIVDRLLRIGLESTDLALVYARIAPRRQRRAEALDLVIRLLKNDRVSQSRQKSALHFAAANLLDQAGRFDEAFQHASLANALRAANYDPVQVERSIQNWIDYFSPAALARLPRAGHGSELPVFIVGMPRSGTSLVEQILASHQSVYGAGELDWIARLCESAVRRCSRGAEPALQCLDRLTAKDASELAAQYLAPLAALNPAAARITDKMPTNFIYLGLIALLFPQARVIHCRRDRLDTCLSCFLTDFGAGYEFSFSPQSLGHFYRQYDRLISHWKSVLDVRMLEVNYEQLVGDVEGQARRMIEFLALPWDERCLRFHENRRFAGTASNAQVRRPVYQTSVGRWRNYERYFHLP